MKHRANHPSAQPIAYRRHASAFTLIELMVVLVLIAIMTAMIIPEMRGAYEGALLRSVARKLASVCELAQSRAIARNETYRVRLESDGHYSVETKNSGTASAPAANDARDSGAFDNRISIQLHDNATDAENEDDDRTRREKKRTIAFYADGTADWCDLILRDREGFQLALRINGVTGRARVMEVGRDADLAPISKRE